jgi:hypothetical protein
LIVRIRASRIRRLGECALVLLVSIGTLTFIEYYSSSLNTAEWLSGVGSAGAVCLVYFLAAWRRDVTIDNARVTGPGRLFLSRVDIERERLSSTSAIDPGGLRPVRIVANDGRAILLSRREFTAAARKRIFRELGLEPVRVDK